MKRLALAAVVVVALTGTLTATAAQTPTPRHGSAIAAPPPRPGPECRASHFGPFAAWAWNLDRWRTPRPTDAALRKKRHRFDCAPSAAHRGAMLRRWVQARERLGQYRTYRLNAPYSTAAAGYDVGHGPRGPADLRYVAIDPDVVCGESGFDFYVNADGLYQIIPSTWASAGGLAYAPTAGAATPLAQHIIAHRLWGTTAWYGLC